MAPGLPDAVVARGPFGIRTWFYNLNGSGGWTSFKPQDVSSYPQYAGDQEAAWTELNTLFKDANWSNHRHPRRVDRPGGSHGPELADLHDDLPPLASCTGPKSANPPTYTTYSSCAVPAGSGFSAGELDDSGQQHAQAEIYYAHSDDAFFDQLAKLNSDMFLDKEAELPAISSSVAALGQAAGNNSSRSARRPCVDGAGDRRNARGDPGCRAGGRGAEHRLLPGGDRSLRESHHNRPPFTSTLNDLQTNLADSITEPGGS